MQILLTLDKKDYEEGMPVFEKYSTRGVIIRDGKIATQHGSAGDYKILGGGVEPGEKLEDALIREVGEESGLIVIPESIRPIGEIVERRRDLFEKNKIYVCHSCFFFCDAKEEMTQTHMTESEIEKGFHLEWATAQEIINGNEPFCEKDSHHIVFTNNLHREEVCIYTPLLSCRKVENKIDITESREGKLWMN